jgi:hypothetical protein
LANKRPIVTLITDFGTVDGYAGVVKGVLLSLAPDLQIVDITHEVEPWNVSAAAWIAANTYKYFPNGTVHVAIVDPGVGTSRRPVAVVSAAGTFVGPDNGIFSAVTAGAKGLSVYELTEKKFWLKPVSATFHGRDIFAPVAARLATGITASQLGKKIEAETLVKLPLPPVVCGENWVEGQIVYEDRFGNLISNIPLSLTATGAGCLVDGKKIGALSYTYASAAGGQPLAVPGSHGFVEIGLPLGSAASALKAGVGSAVRLESS